MAALRDELGKQAERAVEAGDAKEMARLMAAGVSPDFHAAGGGLLQMAVALDRPALVRVLLAAGAHPDDPPWARTSRQGPLARAAGHKSTECLELLLAAGADPDGGVNTLGNPRQPPVNVAAARGLARAVELLGRAGADMDRVGDRCKHSLLHAVESAKWTGDAQCVRICLAFGADPDFMWPGMETAAMAALRASSFEAMLALCEHGFDPSIRNKGGKTAAEMAAFHVGPAADVLNAWLLARAESAALGASADEGAKPAAKPRL